jgi:hypothetical protein
MRLLSILMLVLMFLGNATATASADTHACCDAPECQMVMCVDMGCLPAPAAALPAFHLILPASAASSAQIAASPFMVPTRFEEIWTPPD